MKLKYILKCLSLQLAFFCATTQVYAISNTSSTLYVSSSFRSTSSSTTSTSNKKQLKKEREKSDKYKAEIKTLATENRAIKKEAKSLKEEAQQIRKEQEQFIAESQAYASIPKRDVVGLVVAVSSEWIVIEIQSGDLLSFVGERKPKLNELNNTIAKVLPALVIGDYVSLQVYKMNEFDIVSKAKTLKKKKN